MEQPLLPGVAYRLVPPPAVHLPARMPRPPAGPVTTPVLSYAYTRTHVCTRMLKSARVNANSSINNAHACTRMDNPQAHTTHAGWRTCTHMGTCACGPHVQTSTRPHTCIHTCAHTCTYAAHPHEVVFLCTLHTHTWQRHACTQTRAQDKLMRTHMCICAPEVFLLPGALPT